MKSALSRNLVFAFLGAGIAIYSSVALQRNAARVAAPNIESRMVNVVYCGGCFIGPQFLEITPSFTLPDEVLVGQAFVIEARLDVTEGPSEELKYRVLSNLSASLNLAGAEVVPKGPQPVGTNAEFRWSVTLKNSGEHHGFVTLSETQAGSLSGGSVLSEEGKIAILASSDEDITTMILPIAGGFLGLLIAVTNLIQFYWKWRDRKVQQQRHKREAAPKLILPD